MKIKLGVIGAGAFSMFSVDAFLQTENLSVAGVFDIAARKAGAFASKYQCRIFGYLNEMLEDKEVNLVYISTPPNLLRSNKAALLWKHVICETGPGTFYSEELTSWRVPLCCNLMQRYNPLYQKVSKLIELKLLGGFLHGYFENYASDEFLSPVHWMWNPEISGGIFIEHAVHFFDMFEGWLGKGTVISSQKVKRPGTQPPIYSRVQSVDYTVGGTSTRTMASTSLKRSDRQELRLLFEKEEIIQEWVPSGSNLKD
jgi:predicted dehydrogenase